MYFYIALFPLTIYILTHRYKRIIYAVKSKDKRGISFEFLMLTITILLLLLIVFFFEKI